MTYTCALYLLVDVDLLATVAAIHLGEGKGLKEILRVWCRPIVSFYHIYPTPPLGQDMTQGQFFKRSLTGLNSGVFLLLD